VAARQVDISFGGDQERLHPHPGGVLRIIATSPRSGSCRTSGSGSARTIDRLYGPDGPHVEDAAAALQATRVRPLRSRQTRDVPTRIDVLGRLADGVARLRIGVLQEGFDDAEGDVRDLVLAAVDVLAARVLT